MWISKKGLSLLLLLTVLLGLAYAQQRDAPDSSQGVVWLSWSNQERELYVTGYITGIIKGYARGCRSADKANPQKSFKTTEISALGNCAAKASSYPKNPDVYAQKVTEFYQHYPEDRKAMVYSLLDLLSDNENRSFSQIDEMCRSGSLR